MQRVEANKQLSFAGLKARSVPGAFSNFFDFLFESVWVKALVGFGALLFAPFIFKALIVGVGVAAVGNGSIENANRSTTIRELIKAIGSVPELPWQRDQRFIVRAHAYNSEPDAEDAISTLRLTTSQLKVEETQIIAMLEKYIALQKIQKAGLKKLLKASADKLLLPSKLLIALAGKTIGELMLLPDLDVEAMAGQGHAVGPEPHEGRRFVVELRKQLFNLGLPWGQVPKKSLKVIPPRVVVADDIDINGLDVSDIIDISKSSDKVADLIHSNPTILIVRSATVVSDELMKLMPNLKVIIRAGHGTDNVESKYAEAHGIRVLKTGGSQESVTALTMRMIARAAQPDDMVIEQDASPDSFYSIPEWKTALGKKTKKMSADEREPLEKKWVELFRPLGSSTIDSLKGKTIGIIGFGVIGKSIGAVAKNLGMEVLVYSPTLENDLSARAAAGYPFATKEEIYKRSHFVSLMMELNKEEGPKKNDGMINSDVAALLEQNPNLIAVVNSSRGGLGR